jgi:hypothetical protein
VIKSSIAAVVLFCALSLCHAAESQVGIAKVDLRELEPLLLEVAFAKPENQDIRDRHAVSQERERAMLSGEVDPMEAARGFGFDRMEMEQAVEDLARGELIVLIKEMFGDRYQLVVNDGYGGGILYTEVVIPDITPNIRQRLLKDRTEGQAQPQDTMPVPAPSEAVTE